MAKQTNYERFLDTYSGRELLSKYHLDTEGTWQIKGEDPNCDFGGHHYQPELGFATGKLRDVIEHAVNLSGFFAWGGGGTIKLVSAVKVDPAANERRTELIAKKAALEAVLAKIVTELEKL